MPIAIGLVAVAALFAGLGWLAGRASGYARGLSDARPLEAPPGPPADWFGADAEPAPRPGDDPADWWRAAGSPPEYDPEETE